MNELETNKKIEELQAVEAQLQNFLAQKQTVQIELNEVLNALDEVGSADGEMYKVVAGIMIKAEKKSLSDELDEKKKVLDLRVRSIEKQEKLLEKRTLELRNVIAADLEKSKAKK